jgi:5-methylcytosine-specific restriction protein A
MHFLKDNFMKITELQTEATYKIASQVYDKKTTQKDGANELQNKFGLNINSARDFINDYKHLLNG